ncbi:unnamed protein product [Amoebophrya sp. A25]|nr:unnamed protein product [Amoebophrya sp. A25]|eukprot:GSA25T00016983001.1
MSPPSGGGITASHVDFKFGGRKKDAWKLIKEALEKASIKNAEALRDTLLIVAELAGSLKRPDQFAGVPSLLRQVEQIDPKLYDKIFPTILPKIQEWARQFPTHFSEPVPILRAGKAGKISLSEKQCVYLLAAAFFCILPEPLTDSIQTLNFRKFFRGEEHTQAHKLCAVLRYFEEHTAQLRPNFEREEDEEPDAFKERQKEFRQNVYSRWASRSIELIRCKAPSQHGHGSSSSSSSSPSRRRGPRIVEEYIGVDMTYWSATECKLSTKVRFVENDVEGPTDETEIVRAMELQTARYGGDFLGQGYEAVESFFCAHFQGIAFLLFVEKMDFAKEVVTLRSVRATCDMAERFRYVPREEGYPEPRPLSASAGDAGEGGDGSTASTSSMIPFEVVSCIFSKKQATPQTLDTIKAALGPRPFTPDRVEEPQVQPPSDDGGGDTDPSNHAGSSGGASSVQKPARPATPSGEEFFPEKKRRVVILPYSFLSAFAGSSTQQQLAWVLYWWLVCSESGISELRVCPSRTQFQIEESAKLGPGTEKSGIEGRQTLSEAFDKIVDLFHAKNVRGGLLYALLHEYRNAKIERDALSTWLQTTLLYGN